MKMRDETEVNLTMDVWDMRVQVKLHHGSCNVNTTDFLNRLQGLINEISMYETVDISIKRNCIDTEEDSVNESILEQSEITNPYIDPYDEFVLNDQGLNRVGDVYVVSDVSVGDTMDTTISGVSDVATITVTKNS